MFKLNDSSGERHEIGTSITANQLSYASLHKYIREHDKTETKLIRMHQLKLFYERDECLLAIQFVLKDFKLSEEKGSDVLLYTDPKIMGPVDTYTAKNHIDEITLTLSPDEEIYLIKGHFDSGKSTAQGSSSNLMNNNFSNSNINLTLRPKIDKMAIYTTYGQYLEFGKVGGEYNFSWEYYFNLRYFDGFIVGWNETNITYLASLIIEKPPTSLDEKSVFLSDTTYESRLYNIDPIFLTPRYGKVDSFTTVEDDLLKYNLYQLAKDGEVYISDISVYYEKFINSFEVEYTNKKTGEKIKSLHVGSETKKNKDKKLSLQITSDDCINYIKFTFDNSICSVILKTYRGKSITCTTSHEGENKVEVYDNSTDRTMNILGFILGHQEKINSIQFYYEKKFV